MELRDGDLVLRPPRPEDAEAIEAACRDHEIPRWTLVPSPYSLADAEAFVATSAEEAAGKSVSRLAVDAGDGRLLDSFGIVELDRERAAGAGIRHACRARGGRGVGVGSAEYPGSRGLMRCGGWRRPWWPACQPVTSSPTTTSGAAAAAHRRRRQLVVLRRRPRRRGDP